MAEFTLKEIERITEGELLQGDAGRHFNDISIDSRNIDPGDLFIAIKGENFDGMILLPMPWTKGLRESLFPEGSCISKSCFRGITVLFLLC